MYLTEIGRFPRPRRFPRTRGDVPNCGNSCDSLDELPPHTRGCTRCEAWALSLDMASPAHAGMYLRRPHVAFPVAGFPRTRGDVPERKAAEAAAAALPPHTRGCTPARRSGGASTGASPAHAGMYPLQLCLPIGDPRFPRTRGDVPPDVGQRRRVNALPPHTRGCTPIGCSGGRRQGASPAHAGMYLMRRGSGRTAPRFPRTRGDVPYLGILTATGAELPPHTRGCT